MRNRGRGAGTQHDTGYIGDDYIGDSSFTAETPKLFTKLLILVEAIFIIKRQNRNNVTIVDSSVT